MQRLEMTTIEKICTALVQLDMVDEVLRQLTLSLCHDSPAGDTTDTRRDTLYDRAVNPLPGTATRPVTPTDSGTQPWEPPGSDHSEEPILRSCIRLDAMMMMVLQLVFMYMRWGRLCNWVNGSMLGLFPNDGPAVTCLAAAGEVGSGEDDRSVASAPYCEGNPNGSACVGGEVATDAPSHLSGLLRRWGGPMARIDVLHAPHMIVGMGPRGQW
eukprot:Em0004g1032a